MLPAVRSVPAGGSGECESATAWTGEKRRKTTCPSPLGSPDDATDMMDIQLQEGQGGGRGGGQRHPPEDDEIGDEELNLCLRKIKSRKPTVFLPTATMINNLRELEELHQCFHQLRMEEYSKHTSDYKNWDQYRLILSGYEIDEDYAKYCDELSKKIKWIEEYQHLDDIEFSKLKDRGFKQAMKIAAEFSHLPYSLAVRGYEVEVDDEVLQHISYVIHKLLKVKTYVHYVRKKLKIGRRLQMTPNRYAFPSFYNELCLLDAVKEPYMDPLRIKSSSARECWDDQQCREYHLNQSKLLGLQIGAVTVKLANFKERAANDLLQSQYEDWNAVGDMVVEIQALLLAHAPIQIDISSLNGLGTFLKYLPPDVLIHEVKMKALAQVFFWDKSRRFYFFVYGILAALNNHDFIQSVGTLDFIPIDWISDDHAGVLAAMNINRSKKYQGGRHEYIKFVSGAYTHEEELKDDGKISKQVTVDDVISNKHPRLCLELVRIIRNLGFDV
ncbi:hypothetical protein C2845_PM14G21350 [Panicum miliaceum]|uniref:Uncharacterized protein n=1 Tax=Panicum miliaceum TaxID=4540 RepID=A0A3L6PRX7_PANMI|nr:hypothetical protein C2845_PM14G21350 [Panicum miliaceum]